MEVLVKYKGKTLLKLGSVPEPMTEEELEKKRQSERESCKKRWEEDHGFFTGVPSSKEGRQRFFASIYWWEMPFYLIGRFWDFLMGRKFWYSKNGFRREIE
jgi:hypothetical protein